MATVPSFSSARGSSYLEETISNLYSIVAHYLLAVNTSTVIITNSFVVVSTQRAALASKVLRNGNRSKLCPYISVRSNLLALNR